MISAKEAYDLASPRLDEYLLFIDARIRAAAAENKTSVIIREEPYGHWLYGGEPALSDPSVRKCLAKLRELGYTVTEHYREDIQFVDMGLKIDWGK